MQLTPVDGAGDRAPHRRHGVPHRATSRTPRSTSATARGTCKNLFEKYGNERLVLAAYNAGQGNVDRWRANGQADPVRGDARVRRTRRASEARLPRGVGQGSRHPVNDDPVLELAENANTYTPLGPDRRAHRQRPLRALDGTRRPSGVERRTAFPPAGPTSWTRCGRRSTRPARARAHGAAPGRWAAGDARRSRRAAARARPGRRRADVARGRDGADGAAAAGTAGRRRGAAGADAGDPLASATIAAVAFGGRCPPSRRRRATIADNRRLPRLRRRRAGRAGDGLVQRARRHALRRRDAARGAGAGAYRALVAARWEDAVARGTPVLVTQAGAHVAADPRAARLPRGLRDPRPARPVRVG